MKRFIKIHHFIQGYPHSVADQLVDEHSYDEHQQPAVQPHEPLLVENRIEEVIERRNLLPPDHHANAAETTDVQLENAVESSDTAQLQPVDQELTVHRTEYTEMPLDDSADIEHDHPSHHHRQHKDNADAVHESTVDDDMPTKTEHEIQIQQDYHDHQEHIPNYELEQEELHSRGLFLFSFYYY